MSRFVQYNLSGYTESSNFPTSENAYNSNFTGNQQNAFLAKYTSTGTLLFSTLIGSGPVFSSGGVAVDNIGNIIVVGGTTSASFPTVNAYQ